MKTQSLKLYNSVMPSSSFATNIVDDLVQQSTDINMYILFE